MNELRQRKEFTVRHDDVLLRWIVEGPAGAIEMYAPIVVSDGYLDASKGEVHRHAFAASPDSSEAHRTDCDVMPHGECFFTAYWSAAARGAWREVVSGGGESEVWRFLRYAYCREFGVAQEDKPSWL